MSYLCLLRLFEFVCLLHFIVLRYHIIYTIVLLLMYYSGEQWLILESDIWLTSSSIFRFETITCKKGGINSWHRDYRKWWSKFTINSTECPIHMLTKYYIHIDLTVFIMILMLAWNIYHLLLKKITRKIHHSFNSFT